MSLLGLGLECSGLLTSLIAVGRKGRPMWIDVYDVGSAMTLMQSLLPFIMECDF